MSADPDPFASVASIEGVPSVFAAARDGIDSLLRDRGLRRSTPEDTARSLLLGAAASMRLEDRPVDPDDLSTWDGDPVTTGALRLSTELLGLAPIWSRSPLQALARIHAIVARDLVGPDELGRPATVEGQRRLTTLSGHLLRPTSAPALVVAAITHADIATAGAFAPLDAVVGRAAERLVLLTRGVDPASVTVPEAGHAAEPAGYRSALEAYLAGGTTGVGQWLNYAAMAFTRGADASPVVR